MTLEVPEAIYREPQDYDLEHVGDTLDIDYFVSTVTQMRPRRVLELACGNGRVTVPLAEAGARNGYDVVGVELVPEMLQAARYRGGSLAHAVKKRLTLEEGDMRSWRGERPFDVIVSPCSSFCHLLSLEDQLAAWRCACDNLVPGGVLIIDLAMPDHAAYSDSFRSPARELVEIDLDTYDVAAGTRMIRYKTTRYLADEQEAKVRYLYDKFVGSAPPVRSISDFRGHVYYPREVRLLFMLTGLDVRCIHGDYRSGRFGPDSRQMILHGVRAAS